MGDERPLAIDHIGAAGLANLDLRDHVPDELEVHLRHGDAGLLAAAGQGQGHVRLRLLPEGDRPVVHARRARLHELGIAGEVRLAAEHIHGQPGDSQLLVAARVQITELGDRGDLALEPEEVDPPLLESGGAGRQDGLGGPAHLALDLPDELLDAPRGGLRLLPLHGHQGGLVLLVGEVELDESAGEQRDAHQAREEDHVPAEESAPGPHRITSSARTSSD